MIGVDGHAQNTSSAEYTCWNKNVWIIDLILNRSAKEIVIKSLSLLIMKTVLNDATQYDNMLLFFFQVTLSYPSLVERLHESKQDNLAVDGSQSGSSRVERGVIPWASRQGTSIIKMFWNALLMKRTHQMKEIVENKLLQTLMTEDVTV